MFTSFCKSFCKSSVHSLTKSVGRLRPGDALCSPRAKRNLGGRISENSLLDSTAGPVDVPGPADSGTEGVFHGIRDVHAWHALRSIRHLPQRQGGQGPGQGHRGEETSCLCQHHPGHHICVRVAGQDRGGQRGAPDDKNEEFQGACSH